jgi:hypothetical protein
MCLFCHVVRADGRTTTTGSRQCSALLLGAAEIHRDLLVLFSDGMDLSELIKSIAESVVKQNGNGGRLQCSYGAMAYTSQANTH